jgi:4-diphosphocytidyl-2-C-methyl-D-erythritol kinase
MTGRNPRRLVLPAPAKLNLFIHVTGRRSDGYHLIQTVFQLLDWGDEIELEHRDDGRVERIEGPDDIAPDDDLAVRAARLFQGETGIRGGADIRVRKRIPAGAGLGGGSSDAASVLLGLNRIWGVDWPLARLAALGGTLGADVPVFVHGRSAFAEGIGDELRPVELVDAWFVVVWPGVGVATRDIFQAPELTRNTPALTIAGLLRSATRNDLQPVAIRHCPVIADALRWLEVFGDARMSGSGSSVFVTATDEASARDIAAASPWPAWAVRGVNVSPLHQALAIEA